MTKVNNSAMMTKSPMKDLLAWWQNAKIRIHKYDVVVDERGEGQRICEDWRSTLFTSSCYQPGEKRVLPLPAELSTSPYQAPAPSPLPTTTSSTSQPPLPPALTIVYRLFLDVEDQSLGPSCVLKAKPKHLNRSWQADLINVGGGRAFVAVNKTESVWLEWGIFFWGNLWGWSKCTPEK